MSDERPVNAEPWLGLVSYTSEHKELFFGRGKETDVLLRMIRREPLTTVFGPSGTGKTSLINAAITPALIKDDYLPVSIRLDHNPGSPSADRQIRARLDKEIQNRGLDPSSFAPAEPDESVWEYLHRVELWDADNNPITPVLFFDQFEEGFTLGAGRPETTAFFRDLADLVENYTPVAVRDRLAASGTGLPYPQMRRYKIVLSLREDFVHKLDGLRKQMPSIMQNRFPLTRMNASQALEAVLKPGAGLVTREVAEEIVTFVAGAPSTNDNDADVEVEPALLSVVCRELNFRRIDEGTAVITSEQVAKSSADVLKDFYERSFEEVPIEARYFIEDRLLTGSGFRSTAPEEDAIKAGVPADIIRVLEDRRIIRREQRLKIAHVELTHDLLASVVRESRDARHEQVRLAQERLEQSEREARLLREKEEQEAKLRVSRRLAIVMAVAAVFCLILGGFALVAYKKALTARQKAQEALAQAEKATQDARRNLLRFYEERAGGAADRDDPMEAWLYTIEALSMVSDPSAPIQGSIGRLLLPEVRPGHDLDRGYYWNDASNGTSVRSIAITPDGASVVDGRFSAANQIRVWGKRHAEWQSSTKSGVWEVAVSPDGQTIASASAITDDNKDGALDLWTMTGSPICSRAPIANPKNPASKSPLSFDGVAFSPTGNLVASFASDGSIQLWEPTKPCNPIGNPIATAEFDRIQRISFSADGTTLAAAAGRKIVFWDLSQPTEPKELDRGLKTDDHPVRAVAFNTPNGSRVPDALAAGFEDHGLCWWDLATTPASRICPPNGAKTGSTWSVSISPDRTMVASGHTDKKWRLWDFKTGRLLTEVAEWNPINSIAFSKSGDSVAYGTGDGLVRRLPFKGHFWSTQHDLADFIRNPWSAQNRAAIQSWKRMSAGLGYRFEDSSLQEYDSAVADKARRALYGGGDSDSANRPGGAATVEFTKENVLLYGNKRAKGFPRWTNETELQMVPEKASNAASAIVLNQDIQPPYIVEFEYSIKKATGRHGRGATNLPADGISVMFLMDREKYKTTPPPNGGSRGAIAGNGYAVHFQIYESPAIYLEGAGVDSDSPDARVSLSVLSGLPDLYTDGDWRKVRILVHEEFVVVTYADVEVLKFERAFSSRSNGIGFGAANGDLTADHRIRNVRIMAPRETRE